jgi:hypothetical protein
MVDQAIKRTYQRSGGLCEDRFKDELGDEPLQRTHDRTNAGFVLGRPKFKRQIAAMLGRRTRKRILGRPRKETDTSEQGELAL